MANPPPSFSSFPDLPAFAAAPPPARPSSSRHGASSSRRSRSPGGSRTGKTRDRDDDSRRRDDINRDDRHRRRRDEQEHGDERDSRRRAEPASSHPSHSRRRRSRSRSADRHRSSSSRREKDASGETSRSSSSARPSALGGLPVVNELYYAAGRGDEANVTFGSLHKHSLAKFRRAGAGSVVGLPSGFKIAREPHASGSSALLVEWRERRGSKMMRYSDKLVRGSLNAPSLVIMPAAQSTQSSNLGDYVRFSKRRRIEESVGEPYRAIEDTSESSASEEDDDGAESVAALPEGVFGRLAGLNGEEDEEGADETGPGVGTKESAYRTRNLAFAQRAKEAPLDVANWLAWARFSAHAGFDDRPLASSSSLSSAPSGPSSGSRASIIFTVLDRAALSNPSLEYDPTFGLALLEAAVEAEEPPALAARWDRVLAGPLNKDVNIWRAWGTWQMSSRTGQQAEGDDLTRWAEDGLERLRAMWRDAPPGSTDREDLEGVEIYLFLRACLALREAGYIERAIAIFQAQMELSFYLPPMIVRYPWTEQVAGLERFWETEAPRFGEDGARGWCNSADAGPSPGAPSPPPPPPSATVEDPFALWLAAESVAEEAVLSIRTDDEPRQVAEGQTDEDDPFKLVLWPDVEGFLLPLNSESSRVQLVFALFSFLDLPFAPPEVSTSTPFFSDAFLHNTLAHSSLGRVAFFPDHLRSPGVVSRKLIGDGGMEPEQEGGIPSPHDCPIKATPVTTEALVPASAAGPHLLALHTVDDRLKPLILNVLEQLRRLFHWDPTYSLFAISFEASQSTKNAVKRVKGILAENRDSLVLWNAYARLERRRGNPPDGRKVYRTALSLSSAEVRRQSALGDGDVWTLWRGWVELEQSEGRPAHAVAIVAAAASGAFDRFDSLVQTDAPPVSPLQALQTRQSLRDMIGRTLNPTSPASTTRNSTNLIYLSALFEYLVAGLQAACDVYDRHLEASSGIPGAGREELYLQYADLLFRHVSTPRSTFRPSQVRAVLERGIAAFPSNTALLSYYAATESRMRYQNRVRKVLDEVVLAPATGAKGPNGFLFAIWAELRAVKGRHNEWAVRSLFERGFDRPDANMSLSLWRLAIDHEILLGQLKRAKGLLYRAIKACPWSKDLYLLPFGPLRAVYTPKELEELSDLMAERRIRVRIPLDNFVAGWNEGGSSASEGEDPMRDEAFLSLDERRLISEQEERKRLMPY